MYKFQKNRFNNKKKKLKIGKDPFKNELLGIVGSHNMVLFYYAEQASHNECNQHFETRRIISAYNRY